MKEYNLFGICFLIIGILYRFVGHTSADMKSPHCLTGYMTDYQSWVDEYGSLRLERDSHNALDLSSSLNPVLALLESMSWIRSTNTLVKYLSMARSKLVRVPPVFDLPDAEGRQLSETIEYMSFYGNIFVSHSESGEQYEISLNATEAVEQSVAHNTVRVTTVWSAGFQEVEFKMLKELDLRACSIKILNGHMFRGMKKLEALYIGENEIYHIESQAFEWLLNLKHLDLSRNQATDDHGNPETIAINFDFKKLKKLTIFDLSKTRLTTRNLSLLRGLGKSLRSLSLCETGLTNLPDNIFSNTSLEILDVSRNNGILSNTRALRGLEKTLKVLYAREIGLQNLDAFEYFTQLDILRVSYNEINSIRRDVIKKLNRLRVLDLDKNRLTTWFEKTFSAIARLQLLLIRDNNINLISEAMITDLANVSYVALSGNFIVCNCHVKDFYKKASLNEANQTQSLIIPQKNQQHHIAFQDYNSLIKIRHKVEYVCDDKVEQCGLVENTGIFRLLDYDVGTYICMQVPGSKSVSFSKIDGCNRIARDYNNELALSRNKLIALIALPFVLLPAIALYVFRKKLRYCFIMLRNSAMIGLMNKDEVICDETIFNYDVFVSYCNEDRGWVLDHLLPQMESDFNISACLHERDFQVGLSILENIVSCMDRSRSIMLIISKPFLMSQWCQFEMHLAQHRLLETRREDLTLVLLEEIPRRLRPNTLHYLMLTKTYIVWPNTDQERTVFWKRIKKSLLSQKVKQKENVSLA